jgi:hypothetical protein
MADTRAEAREEILQTVNGHRLGAHRRRLRNVGSRMAKLTGDPRMLSARHIQQAVAIARRHRLVGDDVLAKAGFRPAA